MISIESPLQISIFRALASSIDRYAQKIIVAAILFFFFYIMQRVTCRIITNILMSKAKTKRQKTDVVAFITIYKIVFYVVTGLFMFFIIIGSYSGLGISAGLLTAALGWALQRPITGFAAWIMIITKKPFQLGDRVIIGNVKGDVSNITLTHIHLKEFGGTVKSEQTSGRVILIPNSLLFEEKIINYHHGDDYILDEVAMTVTYDSDLGEASRICKQAARQATRDFLAEVDKKPSVRHAFQPSGVEVIVQYMTLYDKRPSISSDIVKKIVKEAAKSKKVSIAYPHMELLFSKGAGPQIKGKQ